MIFVPICTICQLNVTKIALMVVIIVHAAIHRQHTIVAHMIKIKVVTLAAYRPTDVAYMVNNVVYGALAYGGATHIAEVVSVFVIAFLLTTGVKEQSKECDYQNTANLLTQIHKHILLI